MTITYPLQIFDSSGKANLKLENEPIVEVGKVLNAGKDLGIKVGDSVYTQVKFNAKDVLDDQGKVVDLAKFDQMEIDEVESFFGSFIKFYTDADDDQINGKLIEFKFKLGQPTELLYLLDLSGLSSGEKRINLVARFKDGGGFTKESLIASNAFYLHQSFTEHFQKNISNAGIAASDDSALARENVNFPSFMPIGLQPVNPAITRDVALWEVIRNGTNALSYNNYSAFIDYIFCGGINPFAIANPALKDETKYKEQLKKTQEGLSLPFNAVESYRALKVATEAFVMATITVSGDLPPELKKEFDAYRVEVTKKLGDPASVKILPYLALVRRKLPDVDFKTLPFEQGLTDYIQSNDRLMESCYGLLSFKLQFPCFLELIWNYWHEESMLVQGISTIARRFQNIRGDGAVDPLANVEVGPLRPLNNLLWGYIQDDQHRLSVRRRAYEYDHHYGITLEGTAVKGLRTVDSRSKFIEAFHVLLNHCVKFYNQYDDTTVVADGFPIMNALKEVHMILSEGAHNQFGDLPSTARMEMLMQQYILARPEFREFLPTRQMVAYPEPWMDRVGVLNQLHGWTKTNVLHFRDLGMFGEQIILSIRFGAWSDVINRDQAANWAIFWRPQIQNYMHAYRAVTGVDLTYSDRAIDVQQPSVHLIRKLKEQQSNVKARV